MNESTNNQIVVDEISILDANLFQNIEAELDNQKTQKGLIHMTTNSNQFNQETSAKFESFLEGVNLERFSEGAKVVLMTAPTKWTHFIEEALLTYVKEKLEDIEEQGMFTRIFQNLHEKIAMHTSLAQFVEWIDAESLSFISCFDSLELINKDLSRDKYEVLDLFTTRFLD